MKKINVVNVVVVILMLLASFMIISKSIECERLKAEIETTSTPNVENYYAHATVVVIVDEENDLLYCEDSNGFLWVLEGVGDYIEGDGVALVMDSKGTELIFDDEVVSNSFFRCDLIYPICEKGYEKIK